PYLRVVNEMPDMRIWILPLMTVVAAVAGGCTFGHIGSPADNDQNGVTGGPVSRPLLKNPPQAVKNTLKDKYPHAEIDTIVKEKFSSQVVYEFSFINSDKTPNIRIADNGQIQPDTEAQR